MIKVSRRGFLKALGIGITVAMFNPAEIISAIGKESKIGTNGSTGAPILYTDYVYITDFVPNMNNPILKEIKDVCYREQINKIVPIEYRNKIDWFVFNPKIPKKDPLGQRGMVIWKCHYYGSDKVFITN